MSTRTASLRIIVALIALGITLGSVVGNAAQTNQRQVDPPVSFESSDTAVSEVLELANRRLALIAEVAAWKWQHHSPVTAPAREQQVIQQAGQLAGRLGLSEIAVERLFALQVRLAREEEARLQQRWQANGYDYRGQPASLQDVLRPQLDQLTVQLLRALYLAAPTFGSRQFQARYGSLTASLLRADGWSGTSRSELLEDLHRIGAPSGPALGRIQAAGVLRIGTTGDYAPFSLDVAGRLTGADIELAQALAASLGARAVFIRTSWGSLLQDLTANRFDVAIGGISVTPARAGAAAFSVPYYSGGKTIVARCSDARVLSSLAALDRPSETLIVNPGGTNQQFVQAHLHHARVRLFADNRRIFNEILAHRADAMITDDVEVELQVHAHPGLCRTMAATLTREDKAIVMPKDPALAAMVNRWLRAELARGRPSELIHAYVQSGAGP